MINMRVRKALAILSFLIIAGCEKTQQNRFPDSPAVEDAAAGVVGRGLNPDFVQILPYKKKDLSFLVPKEVSLESDSVKFDVEIEIGPRYPFQTTDRPKPIELGYVGSTIPVDFYANNKTGKSIQILMLTFFHNCAKLDSGQNFKVENAVYANLYLPVRHQETTLPIVRPRTAGAKYYSVQFFAKTSSSDQLVQMPIKEKLSCNPISIVDQPGDEKFF